MRQCRSQMTPILASLVTLLLLATPVFAQNGASDNAESAAEPSLRQLAPATATAPATAAAAPQRARQAGASDFVKPRAEPTTPTATTIVPGMMPFQGYLATGTPPVPVDGTVDLQVAIYSVETGGTPVWGPEAHTAVAVSGGVFNITLGESIPLVSSIFNGETLYLGVAVAGEPELPRTPVLTIPYAFRSQEAAHAFVADIAFSASPDDDWNWGSGNMWTDPLVTGFVGIKNDTPGSDLDIGGKILNSAGVGADAGGQTEYYNSVGTRTIQIDGENNGVTGGPAGGTVILYSQTGAEMVTLRAQETGDAGQGASLYMRNDLGQLTIELDADYGASDKGYLFVDGTASVDVLQINGGADLAEPFDVAGDDVVPGMLVSIDPEHPAGRLKVSRSAYDRGVAGVVSGANDIKPGITLHQEGSIANGRLPISLTGRVYVFATADNGPIHPGDLLTSSDIPGHAMRVADYDRARGAVIGKALSTLEDGTGMVLVLVSLQ